MILALNEKENGESAFVSIKCAVYSTPQIPSYVRTVKCTTCRVELLDSSSNYVGKKLIMSHRNGSNSGMDAEQNVNKSIFPH